jgi:hypothetical protein
MTPSGVRNEWTVVCIVNLQDSVVDRWRGDRGTSYAPRLVVCVAANAAHAATTREFPTSSRAFPR